MSDLTHLFTIGQPVRCRLDEKFYKGTVKETFRIILSWIFPRFRNIAGSKMTSIWTACIRNIIFKNNKYDERKYHMDLERELYKKMTKDELIDKLIAYKNIECHDRAIAHEFLCMQKEDPSRMNFVTHRLTDIADPKRVAEEIRRVKAERTASAQQPIKDELTDTIPVYVTLYKNIRFKKRFDVTLDQLERLKEEDSAESKEVPITLLDETLNLMDATLDALNATNEADLGYELEYSFSYGDPEQPLDGSETEEEVPVAEADDSDVNSEMESVLFDWH